MQPEKIVNICFHGIGEPSRDLEQGESRYWISRDQYLSTLDEVVRSATNVRISFDDANASDADVALEGLVDRRLTATFFALAGRIGSRGSLDADQLRELLSMGMTIGTHGMNHRPWTNMDAADRNRELVVARDLLADIVGTTIDHAALPLGRYNRVLLGHLHRLGYAQIHTSDRRLASPGAWLQPRFSVRSDDTIESLRHTVLAPPGRLDQFRLDVVGLGKRLR